MRMSLALLIAVASMGSVAGQNSPRAAGARPTGMFSNLQYIAEAGDVIGMEVYLVFGHGEYSAIVQCAGGEPGSPIVVSAQVEKMRVSFDLPEGQPECGTSFEGVVSTQGLRGRFRGEGKDRWLPRKKGYWE